MSLQGGRRHLRSALLGARCESPGPVPASARVAKGEPSGSIAIHLPKRQSRAWSPWRWSPWSCIGTATSPFARSATASKHRRCCSPTDPGASQREYRASAADDMRASADSSPSDSRFACAGGSRVRRGRSSQQTPAGSKQKRGRTSGRLLLRTSRGGLGRPPLRLEAEAWRSQRLVSGGQSDDRFARQCGRCGRTAPPLGRPAVSGSPAGGAAELKAKAALGPGETAGMDDLRKRPPDAVRLPDA
jgi:hypothetical protein